jgi:hypothetical protein
MRLPHPTHKLQDVEHLLDADSEANLSAISCIAEPAASCFVMSIVLLTISFFHDTFINKTKETYPLKSAVSNSSVDILHKIETIEKQVMELKIAVLANLAASGKKTTSLKGILKGVEFTDQDIAAAHKSLYDKVLS